MNTRRDEVEAALDFIPTDEQFAASERHLDAYGKPYYTCQSESDPETIWTQRWREGHFWPRCNCPNGLFCFHNKTAVYKERLYQESYPNGEMEAQAREQAAIRKYGSHAYDPTPFSLLKVS